jgi:predicted RNase H-like HicB family nuclease
MTYIVCVEEDQGLWIAHVPDLPGCFANHQDREKAIQMVPQAVEAYVSWCADHGLRISGLSGPMVIDEVIRSWEFEDGYVVNAFFAADRPPLIPEELPEFKHLLKATRADLLRALDTLEVDDLTRELPGERWSVAGILEHVAHSEWWYFDRLGLAFPRAEMPVDPMEALEKVRSHHLANLAALTQRAGVVTVGGETWSARKILRRALWHERDHTSHILKLHPKFKRS